MKLRAIRLAHVGTFAEPTAVEGLSGGLDVLIGPNEMGKSTILRALRTLFTERYTVTGKVVESLRARTGGEPLVEADFDAAGAGWRVTKRFGGRGKSALLVDRDTGRLVAEGPEAEERLVRLVTRDGGAARGISLLWADQGTATTPRPLDDDEHAALSAVIEREIETSADGGMARKLRAAVAEALERHIQVKRRNAKAGSDYERAQKRQAELSVALAEARVAAAAAAERSDEIARLRTALDRLDGAQAAATRVAERSKAVEALEAGRRADLAAKSARADYEKLARDADHAGNALKALDGDLQLLADSEARLAAARRRLADIGPVGEAAAARVVAAEKAVVAARAREAEALAAVVAAERRDGIVAARRERDELAEARIAAVALEAEIAAMRRALASAMVEAAAVAELEAVERDCDLHAARLAAGAPRVRIDYEPGRGGAIHVGGETVGDGAELTATEPLRLVIAGVGTITIAPPASKERDKAGAAALKLAERRAHLLATLAVADIAEARAKLEERRRHETALAAAEARLSAVAKGGMAGLESRLASLDARLASVAPGSAAQMSQPVTREVAEMALAHAREASKGAQTALNTANEQSGAARAELANLTAQLADDDGLLKDVASRLPPAAVRADERARRASAADAASAAAREARAVLAALSQSAPDAAALAEMETAARRVADADARVSAEIARLREGIVGLESAQAVADESGVATRVAETEDELRRADAEVDRYKREVAELELIAEVLVQAETETRERYLRPVSARIAPYLDLVFPSARLGFGGGLTPEALHRDGLDDVVGRLSHGTQEQLAILVRLGFARLLADAGHDVPLILDDALVYADDERIRSMFAALKLAAGSHQVLVLTCRSAVFSGLGGNELTLSPWKR